MSVVGPTLRPAACRFGLVAVPLAVIGYPGHPLGCVNIVPSFYPFAHHATSV
ncbi:hypothetical protein M413DRAFT_340933 [Hebeloma cylindrosporum]|uniref:Uncharacterized protein n=1 Tax=Hebeloma cylindrosporum TaxID=76867 RepID=A0A0C2YWS1_HEBCY|nr:hypothetical protein M413DRAFT_340933 [Hebeloma cylindrosporum h7]